jgi:hypothetical protein
LGSKWAGELEGSFFSGTKFDKCRTVRKAEDSYSDKCAHDDFYVMGVDVGRKGCSTEAAILKVRKLRINGMDVVRKEVVNIYTFDEEHFKMQAIRIKRLFRDYKCRCCVLDGNGPGIGLVDELVLDCTDPDTGEDLYGFGVVNDRDGDYARFKTPYTIQDAMFVMHATAAINSEVYVYTQSQMLLGNVRFLVHESEAKEAYEKLPRKRRDSIDRDEFLRPYTQTSILREQLLNLTMKSEGAHIVLKQSNVKVPKDKVSALVYALYYCKKEEERKERKVDVSKLLMFTPAQERKL